MSAKFKKTLHQPFDVCPHTGFWALVSKAKLRNILRRYRRVMRNHTVQITRYYRGIDHTENNTINSLMRKQNIVGRVYHVVHIKHNTMNSSYTRRYVTFIYGK